jgi:hypothetical protein
MIWMVNHLIIGGFEWYMVVPDPMLSRGIGHDLLINNG